MAWRVVPQLRERLNASDVRIGASVRQTLDEYSAAAAAQSALMCSRAATALDALEAAGIRAAVFKGAGNVASLYDSPSRRMLNDADVILRREDFTRASEVLSQAGFSPAISIPLHEWMALLEDRVYRAHDFLDFIDGSGARLDVHWAVRVPKPAGFSIDSILGASAHQKLGRKDVRTVSPVDSILLTSHHIVRESLAPHSAVKDLLDIQSWCAYVNERWTVGGLVDRARAAGLMTTVLSPFEILAALDPSSIAAEVRDELRSAATADETRGSKRLASLFALQLKGRPVSQVAVGFVAASPRLVLRYVVSRARSLSDSRYRQNKFAGEKEHRVSTEARQFLRDIVSLTPSRIAAYRALGRETRGYSRNQDG